MSSLQLVLYLPVKHLALRSKALSEFHIVQQINKSRLKVQNEEAKFFLFVDDLILSVRNCIECKRVKIDKFNINIEQTAGYHIRFRNQLYSKINVFTHIKKQSVTKS